MGAPELPMLPGEEDLRPTEPIQHPHVVSDESDDDSIDPYDGYQSLPIDDDEDTSVNITAFPNVSPIERADVEIARQVWNAPRPEENQIELDTTRTAQILSAMANFTLPNATIPDWAVNVPEERWKEELLQRIRHRTETGADNKDKTRENNEPLN